MGQRLFSVIDVFRLPRRPGAVIVTADCPPRRSPEITIGQRLVFRTGEGDVSHAEVTGIEMADPPDEQRPLAFLVRPDGESIRVGAEVWSVAADNGT